MDDNKQWYSLLKKAEDVRNEIDLIVLVSLIKYLSILKCIQMCNMKMIMLIMNNEILSML